MKMMTTKTMNLTNIKYHLRMAMETILKSVILNWRRMLIKDSLVMKHCWPALVLHSRECVCL